MTTEDLYTFVMKKRPRNIYVSGKSCTGKSTFANQLTKNLKYEAVELDLIVLDAVVKKFDLSNFNLVFDEVYKYRNEMRWVNSFVKAARKEIVDNSKKGSGLVIEGAIAHPTTLQELFSGLPDFEFVYFHPENLEVYIRYLTKRFITTDENNNGGLPSAFWETIDSKEFKRFCESKVVSEKLSESIESYALSSQKSSESRLNTLSENFDNIRVIQL